MRQLTTEYECFTLRWKWDYGATVTDSTLSHLTICTSQACQEEAGISSSLQFLLQLRNVLKKEYTSVPDLLLWLSRDSHTFQHTILFWNQKHASFLKTQSLTSNLCLGTALFACWSVMSWLAHILSWPLFSFMDFFSQCSLIQGWIEERLEPRNLFGIIATIEALCVRPAGEREKEKTGVLLWCALLEETTTRLWLTLIILCGLHYWMGIGSGHAFAFVYPWVGWERSNLNSDLSVAT